MKLQRIAEFRQYRLHPGARETLVALFEREFVETQEACGIHVAGIFRDLDDPDRFTWLRGFDTMEARATALGAFYDGPVWARHRNAANATMIDSDDVHLLETCDGEAVTAADGGAVLAIIVRQRGGVFRDIRPAGRNLGSFRTLAKPNNWPRLPVNEGDPVRLWLAGFGSVSEMDAARAGIAGKADDVEYRRLTPTARSRLR